MILLRKAEASELDEKNAMALAIVPVGKALFFFYFFLVYPIEMK